MKKNKEHSTLIIVESPAKAKTIEKYLGPGYTCLLYTSDAADEL